MNNSTAKVIRQYLKERGIDIHSPEGKRLYRDVKRKLPDNKNETVLASKKKS